MINKIKLGYVFHSKKRLLNYQYTYNIKFNIYKFNYFKYLI